MSGYYGMDAQGYIPATSTHHYAAYSNPPNHRAAFQQVFLFFSSVFFFCNQRYPISWVSRSVLFLLRSLHCFYSHFALRFIPNFSPSLPLISGTFARLGISFFQSFDDTVTSRRSSIAVFAMFSSVFLTPCRKNVYIRLTNDELMACL